MKNRIREILFPGFYDKNQVRTEYARYLVGQKIEYIQYNLTKQVSIALGTRDMCEECPRSVLQQQAEDAKKKREERKKNKNRFRN